jgi:hypothetical protein
MKILIVHLFFIICLFSCSSDQKHPSIDYEPIWKISDEQELAYVQEMKKRFCENDKLPALEPITKEYFRCKGSSLNLPRVIFENGKETMRYYDCPGSEKHSLPLYEGKEFIFPVLIELLNEIQKQTASMVVITSGHRCPVHQLYLDSAIKAQSSKHIIGAEVSFYVQGMQNNPEKILQIIFSYYKTHENYKNNQEYTQFLRYQKETDVSMPPWYNKEILIKLYRQNEGRNFDNKHSYQYISIQVRFDRDKNKKVSFSHEQAQNYLRK